MHLHVLIVYLLLIWKKKQYLYKYIFSTLHVPILLELHIFNHPYKTFNEKSWKITTLMGCWINDQYSTDVRMNVFGNFFATIIFNMFV